MACRELAQTPAGRAVDWSPRRRRCLIRFRWVELQAAGTIGRPRARPRLSRRWVAASRGMSPPPDRLALVPSTARSARSIGRARVTASTPRVYCCAGPATGEFVWQKILHWVVSGRTRSITSCLLCSGFGDSILATSEPFTARDQLELTDRIEGRKTRMRTS